MSKSIAVIGASSDREKFGNKAVRAYAGAGWTVYPVHPREREIEGLTAYADVRDVPTKPLDMVTLYVPPKVGLGLLEHIAEVGCGELMLNPGAASEELVAEATRLGLNPVEACSILALGAGMPD